MAGDEMWISVAIGLLRGLSVLYDILSFLPAMILDKPKDKLDRSARVKALPLRDGDPSTAFRSVDRFEELSTTPFPGCSTLDELFARAARVYSKLNCLGTRQLLKELDETQANGKVFKKAVLGKYDWVSYEEVDARCSHLGSGLLALGQKPRSNILLFAETRAEWMMTALSCFKYNFPVVTLYSTLGEEAIVHGVNESEVSFVITSADLLPKFKKILSRMPRVEHLVYMEKQVAVGCDPPTPDLSGFPSSVHIHSMTEVERLGARPDSSVILEDLRVAQKITKPVKDDIAVIMYTSGSTGLPKGVLISHGNLMCGISGQVGRIPNVGPSDTYIGYLPLAHVLELSAELACLSHGVNIGYSSPNTLSDQSSKIKKGTKGDASELKPTLMAAVPLIMDRLYKGVMEKVNRGSPFSRALFNFAYEYKKAYYEKGFSTPIVDALVFSKTRALIGGRVRMMLSGGAPLSGDTQRFMNICFCCPVGQGYGLTETCGAGTIHEATDRTTGRVGAPLTCNQIKLVDWEEGGYHASDKPHPRGEVWIGGGNVTMGYYKNADKTQEEFCERDGQRWFSTGDIGVFESDGCLKIIDRKKDLVKLQAGEYVSLGKVETALKLCPLIDNLCMYADSMQAYTVALVVPNEKALLALARELGLVQNGGGDLVKLCHDKTVQTAVLKALQAQGTKGKLERFEIPQKIKLCEEAWTPELGLVTDAFKLKRKELQKHYEEDLSLMYKA